MNKITQFHKLVLKAKTDKQLARLYNYADNQIDSFDIMSDILTKYGR